MKALLFEAGGRFYMEVPKSFVEVSGMDVVISRGRGDSVEVPVDYDRQPKRVMAVLRPPEATSGGSSGPTWCGLSEAEIEALHHRGGGRTASTSPVRDPRSSRPSDREVQRAIEEIENDSNRSEEAL